MENGLKVLHLYFSATPGTIGKVEHNKMPDGLFELSLMIPSN